MLHRRARLAMIALILAFPTLLALANSRKEPVRNALIPVALTTTVLVSGLSIASRERRRQPFTPTSRLARQSNPSRSPSTAS